MSLFEPNGPHGLASEVERIAQEYLLNTRGGESDFSDLTGAEREELLALLQDELRIELDEERLEALQSKRRLRVEDLVGAFRHAQKEGGDGEAGYY